MFVRRFSKYFPRDAILFSIRFVAYLGSIGFRYEADRILIFKNSVIATSCIQPQSRNFCELVGDF